VSQLLVTGPECQLSLSFPGKRRKQKSGSEAGAEGSFESESFDRMSRSSAESAGDSWKRTSDGKLKVRDLGVPETWEFPDQNDQSDIMSPPHFGYESFVKVTMDEFRIFVENQMAEIRALKEEAKNQVEADAADF
jgi:hypothetical protein